MQIGVELIDHMGSDLSVVNAARVSFDKASKLELVTTVDDTDPSGYGRELRLSSADAKLIAYLAKHGHWSPFAHCFVSTRISAPIFVARQLQKHTVGLAWNEVSRRYVDNEPTFYTPETWRKRAENVKQGSSDEAVSEDFDDEYRGLMYQAKGLYDHMLANGVAPEQARMVLPQSMMTEWIWSGSLMAFARVCKSRTDPHAQGYPDKSETYAVAAGIAEHCSKLFPVSWEALVHAA